MEKQYRLVKVIVDCEHKCNDTTINIIVDRETAKQLLKEVGKDLRSLSHSVGAVSVYHGKENGNFVTCTLMNI